VNERLSLKTMLVLAGLLVSSLSASATGAPVADAERRAGVPAADDVASGLTAYVFKSATCPHCNAQRTFLDALDEQHERFGVRYFEVLETSEHHDLLRSMAEAFDIDPGSIPMVFIADSVWIGDSARIRQEIAARIDDCLSAECPDARALAEQRSVARLPLSAPGDRMIRLPWVGDIDLGIQPLVVSTAIIAFVDGFNPCSLWLLTMLIALVIHSGSRRRVLLVGSVFLVTTATVYGLFMVGVFNVLVYAEYLPWMYWVVALFALTFGLVNIKDYFWFRRGFSFTIDDRHKPGIFRRFRELIAGGRSPAALAGATLVMALGIALIELPCTAGFPVIWSGLLSAHDVNPVAFAGLLAVYLAIYLLDELVVFGLAAVKLRIDRFEERQARVLKLVGGTVMIALAVVLIVEPDIMSDVGPALGVFLVAFAAAGLIVVLHRYLLPRLGIQLGNGDGR